MKNHLQELKLGGRPMKAKEMFEKLGYKELIKHKTYGDDNTVYDITIEELKAINKQIEELGWNK